MEQVRAVAPTRANGADRGRARAPASGSSRSASTATARAATSASCGRTARCPARASSRAICSATSAQAPIPTRCAAGASSWPTAARCSWTRSARRRPGVQVRLLRVLQERAFERIGGTQALHADVRLVASTSRDLAADARAGRFRDGPAAAARGRPHPHAALRERRDDIPLLVEASSRSSTASTSAASPASRRAPRSADASPLAGQPARAEEHGRGHRLSHDAARPDRSRRFAARAPLGNRGRRIARRERGDDGRGGEKRLIAATLRHTGGDKPRAAAMLGIGLRTLYRKVASATVWADRGPVEGPGSPRVRDGVHAAPESPRAGLMRALRRSITAP